MQALPPAPIGAGARAIARLPSITKLCKVATHSSLHNLLCRDIRTVKSASLFVAIDF